MYLEIYLDVIFVINFIMDYLLLTIVKKALKWDTSILRRLLGATVGSIGVCVLTVISPLNYIIQFLISYFVLCVLMVLTTYKPKSIQIGIKSVIMLYLVTFLLGGIINSLYYHSMLGYYMYELINGRLFNQLSTKMVLLLAVLSIIVITVLVKPLSKIYRKDVSLFGTELILQDKSICLTGLLDTGNNLFDPVFGKPVIIIEYSSLKNLLSFEQERYLKSLITDDKKDLKINPKDSGNICVFMIPYQSIGKKKGLLPAIIINKMVIKKNDEKVASENVLTAIWNGSLSRRNKYQLILHKDLL